MNFVIRVSLLTCLVIIGVIVSFRELGKQQIFPAHQTEWLSQKPDYWLIAQGGGEPQNTLWAFRKTKKISQDIVLEVEVRATLDGHWILYAHDRLESQTEKKGYISWHKWSEIKDLNPGFSYQNKKGEFPFRKNKLKLIKFEDFIKWHKDLFILTIGDRDTLRLPGLIKIIEKQKAQKRVLILSKTASAYRFLKTQRPQWNFIHPTSKTPFLLLLNSMYLETLIHFDEPVFLSTSQIHGIDVYSPRFKKQLEKAHKQIWLRVTENDKEALWPGFAKGILTSRPDKFLDLFKSLNKKNKKL